MFLTFSFMVSVWLAFGRLWGYLLVFGCGDNNFGGGGDYAHHRRTVLGPSAAEVVYAK
jgi:hypothetical protein